MRFHIISNDAGEIMFLRRMNAPFVRLIRDVNPGADNQLVSESVDLQHYIDMALNKSFSIDYFDLEINNENLKNVIQPVIRLTFSPSDPNGKKHVIDTMIQQLTNFPFIDNRMVNIESFNEQDGIRISGIYIYLNTTTSIFYITRLPCVYHYFSNFILKYSQINLGENDIKFLSSDNFLQTSDPKIIDAYCKFIDSLSSKEVRGFNPSEEMNGQDLLDTWQTLSHVARPIAPENNIIPNHHRHKNNLQLRDDPPIEDQSQINLNFWRDTGQVMPPSAAPSRT